MRPIADYSYSFDDGELVIIDDNRGGPSVTNDIENVLGHIAANAGRPWPPKLVIYRDSEGTWDGVRLDERGGFVRFYHLGETAVERALEIARALDIARAAVGLTRETRG